MSLPYPGRRQDSLIKNTSFCWKAWKTVQSDENLITLMAQSYV